MNDTLIMKVNKPLQDLRDVHPNECLGELAEFLAYVME